MFKKQALLASGSTRLQSVENSLWKRLRICRKTRLCIQWMTDIFQKVLNC